MPESLKMARRDAPLVLLGGHVTRASRDRFAALARREGYSSVAGYLRYVVEELTGEVEADGASVGSARKLNLRLRDRPRAALLDGARARRSTPAAWATALLEGMLSGDGGPVWGKREVEELRALYAELKAVEQATADPAALNPLRTAMLRVLGNLALLQGAVETR